MTVHFRSSFEDFTHEANVQFMEGKGWFNTFKNDWQLYLIKCNGVGSDILTDIAVMGCYSKEQAALNTHPFDKSVNRTYISSGKQMDSGYKVASE